MKILYTYKVKKDLKQIEQKQIIKILEKIKNNIYSSEPLLLAKKLKSLPGDFYRYRVGNYRVIFIIDNNKTPKKFTIISIKHRKDIYKKF